MKTKITRKELNQNCKCFSVSYCGAESLLSAENPLYYHAGVYGWNFDAYILYNDGLSYCINTGYRSMINNFDNNNCHALYREYDKKAEAVKFNHDIGYKEQDRLITALLHEYLTKVIDE